MDLVAYSKRIYHFLRSERGKLFAIITACSVTFFLSFALITPHLFSDRYIKREISKRIKKSSGYKTKIYGDVELKILPWPNITAKNIVITDEKKISDNKKSDKADKDSKKKTIKSATLKIRRMSSDLMLSSLLIGRVRAKEVHVHAASIQLALDNNGHAPWLPKTKRNTSFVTKDKTSYFENIHNLFRMIPYNVVPRKLVLHNSSITYRNPLTQKTLSVEKLNTDIQYERTNGNLHIKGSGVIDKTASDWSLKASNIRSLFTSERSHIAAGFADKHYNISIDGFIERNAYKGSIDLSFTSLAKNFPSILTYPLFDKIQSPLAMRFYSKAVRCKYYSCKFPLSKIQIDRIAGKMKGSVSFENRIPEINLDVRLNKANLNQLTRVKKGRRKKARKLYRHWFLPIDKQAILSKSSITPKLPNANINLEITAKKMLINRFKIRNADFDIAITPDSFALKATNLGLFDGTLSSSLNIINLHKIPRWLLLMDVNSASVNDIITKLTHRHFVSGAGDIKLNLSAYGHTPHDLTYSLSGSASVRILNGHLAAADLSRAFRNINEVNTQSRAYQKANLFNVLTSDFIVKDGLISNKSLMFVSKLMNFKGSGSISLPDYSIDYNLIPEKVILLNNFAASKDKTSYPLKVKGPLDKVDITTVLSKPISRTK